MASVVIAGDTSGTVTLQAPAVAGSTTLTLPASSGTLARTSDLPVAGAWTLIEQTEASNSATISFTNLSSYRALRLTIENLLPATSAVGLHMRVSSDNGASYLTTETANLLIGMIAGAPDDSATTTSGLLYLHDEAVFGGIGNLTTNGGVSGSVLISNFNQSTYLISSAHIAYGNASGAPRFNMAHTIFRGSTARDALRILMSSGNITSGRITLEGTT
jgi:hypothetical protein